MSISKQQLAIFSGQKIKATAINIKCAEDIGDIREHLVSKYGQENIHENSDAFIVNGKVYTKPWLPRERAGVFKVRGEQYYIEAESSSADGRMSPRKSFYPISVLSLKDENTLVAILDIAQDFKIEYILI
ncbi:hypothetical protein KSB07_03175 [Acinetobacter junii]|uniref:hypothetical protein n=1 Tax=Acinetobacter junii TaxID=40215 RepID=UPI001F43134B|nr:hypothetical protein [Acinetobacter junii]MCE6003362.1 hypothetical protein [Acinetobacter junii]